MAAFEDIQNMHDTAFKPKFLRSLVREYVPDDKNPLKSPLDLSYVVSMVKYHQLLSETDKGTSKDPKVIESWKVAINAWVNRILALASGDMPDKCWAGICLLGLTCQECSSERFVASYSDWLQKLHLHIQTPADSHSVKVATCASLSDLFSRLGRLPRVKKDANAQAAKFVQPILKLLNEDSSEAVWEGAVVLLSSLITFYPSSVQRAYDKVEAALVSKIMLGKCSSKFFKELGQCLALLPKSRGDEESWSLMMHKILYTLNVHLNDVFQGVEEESRRKEALNLLVPPGKDPPPPLGGIGEASEQKLKKTERLHISSVSVLMHCCYMMLTDTYPAQVRIPIRSLMVLIGRVLMVDGSSSHANSLFMTSMQQELICSQLPILHLHSLELLRAVIKSVRSQLLPHAAEMVRILKEYLKRCLLPHLRIEVYAVIKILLMSMGVGVSTYLAQDIVKNAFVDLDMVDHVGVGPFSNATAKVSNGPLQRCQKKRKTKGSKIEQPIEELESTKIMTPLALKIAALEALESVLTVAGALGAESWRPSVDRLLITVATNACKGGWGKEINNNSTLKEHIPTMADFQLAALKSLLASLLSPARYRPPYLAQGLDLFRRGMREMGTKLAEFCAHALLALEVLIHPRALPLIDYSCPNTTSLNMVENRFSDFNSFGYQQDHIPNSSISFGKETDKPDIVEDDLYKSWLEVDTNKDIQGSEVRKYETLNSGTALEKTRVLSPERVRHVPDSSNTGISGEIQDKLASERNDEKINGEDDENMVEAHHDRESAKMSAQQFSRGVVEKMGSDYIDSEENTRAVNFVTNGSETVGISSVRDPAGMKRALDFTVEDDSDMESLPDIVDEDPVSESESD